jgi:hypothetical protein
VGGATRQVLATVSVRRLRMGEEQLRYIPNRSIHRLIASIRISRVWDSTYLYLDSTQGPAIQACRHPPAQPAAQSPAPALATRASDGSNSSSADPSEEASEAAEESVRPCPHVDCPYCSKPLSPMGNDANKWRHITSCEEKDHSRLLSRVVRPGSSKSRALGISPRGCWFVSHPEQFFRPSHAVKLTRPGSGIPL